MFGLILEIPNYIFTNVKDDICLPRWPEEWMFVTYYWIWFAVEVLLVALMAGLYTKAVYTLWFKRNDGHNLRNCQNRVSDDYARLRTFIESTNIFLFRFMNQNCSNFSFIYL